MSEETKEQTGKRGRPKLDRKSAPDVSIVEEVYKDPRKSKLDQAWSAIAKDKGWNAEQLKAAQAEWHTYFSRGDVDPEMMEAEGYKPFMVSANGTTKQVRDRGDLLWIKNADDVKKVVEGPAKLATQMLQDTLDGNSDKYSTKFDKNPN